MSLKAATFSGTHIISFFGGYNVWHSNNKRGYIIRNEILKGSHTEVGRLERALDSDGSHNLFGSAERWGHLRYEMK